MLALLARGALPRLAALARLPVQQPARGYKPKYPAALVGRVIAVTGDTVEVEGALLCVLARLLCSTAQRRAAGQSCVSCIAKCARR
jgi:hypothetical protein